NRVFPAVYGRFLVPLLARKSALRWYAVMVHFRNKVRVFRRPFRWNFCLVNGSISLDAMKFACRQLTAVILALLATTVHAEEMAAKSASPPSLEGVTWAGPGVTLSDLRGKSVVILVYVTEYQADVDWPTQFLAQLKLAAQNKPVVILAINADKKADLDLAYMNARQFNGPNIVHGRDPLL